MVINIITYFELEKALKGEIDEELSKKILSKPNKTLYRSGNIKEIKQIIKIIKKYELNLTKILSCTTILALGKAQEIKEIIDVLKPIGLEIINQCPTILARGKAQEIKEIIAVADKDTKLGKDYSIADIKKYLMYSGKYNRCYSTEELDELCFKIGITREQLFCQVINLDIFFFQEIEKVIRRRGNVWVGGSTCLTKNQL